MNQKTTGYLFALGAALALSSSFIFSKSALNHVTMIQFGAVWFTMGVVWNSIWYFGRRKYRGFSVNTKKKLGVALLIAILEGVATGLFYLAIKAMENPAVVSFIGNIGPVFVTVIGITLLKEKFKGAQLAGILITIAGVFVINFRDGAFLGFLDPGAVYVIAASFFFSLATISGRKFRAHLEPELMSLIRTVMLAAVFVVLIIISDEPVRFAGSVWRDLALGSLFETVLTIVFAYQALRRIEATTTSLIISSKGVWTLFLAWIFLQVFPSGVQLVGGALTLVGIYLITKSPRASQKSRMKS
ncbi:MAG: DMT family transporter [Bacteroidales bacterium]|nr:DMT family transporter [Bacteroidales bacterium]